MEENPKTLDEQLMSLKTRPYTKRQCKCPNCQSGIKIVGPSGRKMHNCHWLNCSRQFDDASRLAVHVQRHEGQREFVCNWPGCGKQFFRKDHLKGHVQSHTGENVTCKVCGFRALSKAELASHVEKLHQKKPKCSCPNCLAPEDQRLTGSDGRRLHTCHYEDCGRIFAVSSRLQIHLQRHIGERTYACLWENCDRKFYRKDHLKTHMSSHTGDMSYVCPICEYRFAWKKGLLSHMKTHEMSPLEEKKIEVKEPVPIRIKDSPGPSSPLLIQEQVQELQKIQPRELKKSDFSAFEEIKQVKNKVETSDSLVPHPEQFWYEYFYFQQQQQQQQQLYTQYLMQIQAFEEQRKHQPPIIRPLYRPW